MTRLITPLALAALLASPGLWAEELLSDWIQPVQGAKEKNLGAEMSAVDESGEEGRTVTISIPKASLDNQSQIEEVIIYGQREDRSEPRLDIRHEWLSDYDRDHYGLVLYLGKEGNIPLRLYLKTQETP